MKKTIYYLSFAVLMLYSLSFTFVVKAIDYTSSNFLMSTPTLDNSGGQSSSTNFEQTSAIGQIAPGESNSSNFLIRSGFLYFDESFVPKSQNWRWYDDENNETPTDSLALENTAPNNIDFNNILKLRLTIKETANMFANNVKFKLQFATSSDFSIGVTDVAEIGSCTVNSGWCYATGAGDDNAVITTKNLSDADSCAGGIGDGCGTHNTSGISASSFDPLASSATEYEFTIKRSGSEHNTTFFFRAYDITNDQVVLINSGANYPSLATSGVSLTFTINGLPSGTIIQDVTTDVSTQSTSVSFDSLVFDAETEAAQRLSVTTDAVQGYQIYVWQNQGLLSSQGSEIVPVIAPNDDPAAWAIPSGEAGAYGYHSDDSTLYDGSARFAASDTYAKFETTAKEVVYSSIPVTNETTNIVYKTQVTNQQVAGSYNSSVVYIIVPTF